MFKNRCCERPMSFSQETQMNFTSGDVYPTAVDAGMMGMGMGMPGCGCTMPPVQECPQERVCHKEFVHEVPHIVPINTRVINHHIYKHSYTPCYTCCEENIVSNVYDGCPNKF